MPELPEVETIVRDLQPLVNKKIKDLSCSNSKTLNLPVVKFKQQVLNLPLQSINRLGKHLVISLPNKYLVIHLKMTGQLIWRRGRQTVVGGHPIINQGESLPNRFTRVILTLSDNSQLFFNVRKFGWWHLLTPKQWLDYVQKFGVEPLTKQFSLAVFNNILQSRARSKIKSILLDQHKILGIGNIYADESLFLAGIKPQRLASSLTQLEIKKLWQAISKVLRWSIKHRGTSFNDYVDARGQSGNFVEKLQVYGRQNQFCYQCGQTITKIKLAGRGTHYCQQCQH